MPALLKNLQNLYGPAGAREMFQKLVLNLIKNEYPKAATVRDSAGDEGIDVHVGDLTDPNGIDVYQTKWFPEKIGDSQKAQIRDSFKTCRENVTLKQWTLRAKIRGHAARASLISTMSSPNLDWRWSIIDETEWSALGVDVKAQPYERSLEKAASEGKRLVQEDANKPTTHIPSHRVR